MERLHRDLRQHMAGGPCPLESLLSCEKASLLLVLQEALAGMDRQAHSAPVAGFEGTPGYAAPVPIQERLDAVTMELAAAHDDQVRENIQKASP